MTTVTDETWLSEDRGAADDEVAFDYIKGPDFCIKWVDGAMGGPTPSGQIYVALYAERPAIPRRQVYKIDPVSSTLGSELIKKRLSRDSIVREMSIDAHMTIDTAESLGRLLLEIAEEAKSNNEKGKE